MFGESLCKIKNYLNFPQNIFYLILIFTKSCQNAKIVSNAWNFETKFKFGNFFYLRKNFGEKSEDVIS